MNKPANDDSISRVFPKKTNLCFLEALGSLMFLLGRGCQRLGQPIEKPISPRPSGTGIFPYSSAEARAPMERSRLDFLKAVQSAALRKSSEQSILRSEYANFLFGKQESRCRTFSRFSINIVASVTPLLRLGTRCTSDI
jgi:hypothetical protein